MKLFKQFCLVVIFIGTLFACKNENQQTTTSDNNTEVSNKPVEKTGQAFIKDDASKPNCLQIAIASPNHKTLVAAVQAAQVENALVNVGPLTVFAPTDDAFAALPEGTVDNLLKPENKADLANILKYHVTPGNYSKDFLTKFKKLGQANNGYVPVTVENGEPIIGGAKIIASVPAGNGVVHVIDKVLLPPSKE
ncbi:fasciclin domain-containing protein [Mangrovimonas spongiae]|uniref:Fasciclin domain-containing protein n=1 Tax=Mangrovimonas spongiae TaxID=2494697 RepID=A0A428JYT4_9FLAO|nr:fasciclin domain-containing protein [Mangrovimonas spongiae]RSK39276.1 fasciclin domain-containing protein [Mangrovimonas spongiae]